MSEYYTIKESDAGRYTFSAFGRTWAADSHRVERGRLLPVTVNPAYIGKRAYPFTDDAGRECLQVEGTGGRRGRFTVAYENLGA